ncbi:hypothetical protein PABY_12680 [Pyrodictium abyssi]|uniref:Uncharacterized protein n=1 Tax=Pyrodictium abyssi TaxID=54256 RepID=A0ABM8IXT5_9CREN|nr:hypothetical protein PABY_12680 [Pyrodictium abyssi]
MPSSRYLAIGTNITKENCKGKDHLACNEDTETSILAEGTLGEGIDNDAIYIIFLYCIGVG